MKIYKTLVISTALFLSTGCAILQPRNEYTAVKPDAVHSLISEVQQAIRLSSGTLIDAGIKLDNAELTLGVGNVVSFEGNLGVLLLTAGGTSTNDRSQEIVLVLEHKPIPLSNKLPKDGRSSIVNNYVVLKDEKEIKTNAGKLATAISSLLVGIAGSRNADIPLVLKTVKITIALNLSTGRSGGVAGIELGEVKLGATSSVSSSSSNKIVLSFKSV